MALGSLASNRSVVQAGQAATVAQAAPLDHGLAMRASGVRQGAIPIGGDVVLDWGERRWTFTPAVDWDRGPYELTMLDILEDVAGNQIGRAFEVDVFDSVDESPVPQTIAIPFTIA